MLEIVKCSYTLKRDIYQKDMNTLIAFMCQHFHVCVFTCE